MAESKEHIVIIKSRDHDKAMGQLAMTRIRTEALGFFFKHSQLFRSVCLLSKKAVSASTPTAFFQPDAYLLKIFVIPWLIEWYVVQSDALACRDNWRKKEEEQKPSHECIIMQRP